MSWIEFRHVSFRYHENEPWVLDDVSFVVQSNESVALIGKNGSGKSTIAKLMIGLLQPQAGEIFIDGQIVNEETIWDIRSQVGLVFQNPENQFVGTTVYDDVAFGLENLAVPREEMTHRIERSLQQVGMLAYRDREPHDLSGGQKQRIALASVLAVEPKILLLDEATSMLDPHGTESINQLFRQLKREQNMTHVTVTHDTEEVMYADRVLVIDQGKIAEDCTPRQLFCRQELLDEYGLRIPFIVELTNELYKQGISLDDPMNHKELLDQLWTFHLTE
ncbi:cobalt/nickel ABC transporter ATP-binding protein [Gracilibacillus halophilus YIM-C55.5]|uniref:Cobalt/nickel ABC transporter ATP-binding protein n=1 Tax=Gracilibacillus halophilus YIM-C55.5 TaxID=1308866 RepID=N4WBY8_9BACI|nr:energy-coupling factor transporter ATPase [Gracilibacillus halophilus]ENH97808.1 cobalt/nickel ABC transporter ATP-binding protein [Gracilibacillus halophilus YIM-C55.5]